MKNVEAHTARRRMASTNNIVTQSPNRICILCDGVYGWPYWPTADLWKYESKSKTNSSGNARMDRHIIVVLLSRFPFRTQIQIESIASAIYCRMLRPSTVTALSLLRRRMFVDGKLDPSTASDNDHPWTHYPIYRDARCIPM